MRPRWFCWTRETGSRRRPRPPAPAALGALAAFTLAACSPTAPPGVDQDRLDAEVSRAVGDPNTCVLIARKSDGRVLYQYNSAVPCGREFPACEGQGVRGVKALLDATRKDGRPRRLSCNTEADASRGVGWASGPIAGTDLVYAAMMEGDRAFPGRMMADRVESAFRRAGVSPPPPP